MAIQKLVIDMSGRGGLSDNHIGNLSSQSSPETQNINTRYLADDNQMVSGFFNPILNDGYCSPGLNATSIVPITPQVSFTQLMAASQVDEVNGNVYFFENGTKIQLATGLDDVTFSDDRTITNGTGTDLAIYQINGVRTLFYSYRYNNTETRIGIKNLVAGTYTTDVWLGTGGTVTNNFVPTLSTAKMIPSGDGFMYILTQNTVHRVDGTAIGGSTGTIYKDILKAPDSFYLSHGIDYRNNLYIVVQKNTLHQVQTLNVSYEVNEVGVYIWNRQSSFFNTSDFIPIQGIREIRSIFVAPNGKVRIICISGDLRTQIREYNGTEFKLLKELPFLSYPVYEDSLQIVNGFTVWLSKDTKIYYYGSEKPGEKEFLFTLTQFSTNANSVGGSIAFAQQRDFGSSGNHGFYLSYQDNSTKTMKKYYPFATNSVNDVAMNKGQGDIYTPVKFLPRMSTVKHIDIYMKQTPFASGLTVVEATLKIYFNQSATAWASKSVTRADINKGYISIEVNKPFINSIQIETEHTTTTTLGSADFAPAYAIIEYESTGTIK